MRTISAMPEANYAFFELDDSDMEAEAQPKTEKARTKTPVTCRNCGHTWLTVRRYAAFCRKCGVHSPVVDTTALGIEEE